MTFRREPADQPGFGTAAGNDEGKCGRANRLTIGL
jgi:hypothetical protein